MRSAVVTLVWIGVWLSCGCASRSQSNMRTPRGDGETWQVPAGFVDLSTLPHVRVELRYATTNNFVGRNLYGSFRTAYLHPEAAAKFRRAGELLTKQHPGHVFIVYDALRPRSVQRQLFAVVRGTPQESYVANPDEGSVHNFGFALDLTVAGPDGRALDMGAGFDQMDELAEPRLEDRLLREGRLKPSHLKNRMVLRSPLETAGFKGLPDEWWHFDALPGNVVRKRYPIVE